MNHGNEGGGRSWRPRRQVELLLLNVLLLLVRFLLQSIHSQNYLLHQATVLPCGGGRGGREQGLETDSTQSRNVRPSLKF